MFAAAYAHTATQPVNQPYDAADQAPAPLVGAARDRELRRQLGVDARAAGTGRPARPAAPTPTPGRRRACRRARPRRARRPARSPRSPSATLSSDPQAAVQLLVVAELGEARGVGVEPATGSRRCPAGGARRARWRARPRCATRRRASWKRLRRCDSTVLSLRNSAAAISRFVRRSVTSPAISSSRLVSALTPESPAVAGPARLGARAELAQLAPDLVADAGPSRRRRARARPRAAPRSPPARSPAAASARPSRLRENADLQPRAGGAPRLDGLAARRAPPAPASPRASRTAARVRAASAGEQRRGPSSLGDLLGPAGVGVGRRRGARARARRGRRSPSRSSAPRGSRSRGRRRPSSRHRLQRPLDVAGLEAGRPRAPIPGPPPADGIVPPLRRPRRRAALSSHAAMAASRWPEK